MRGLPILTQNPEFSKATFSVYCPKLKEWVNDVNNHDAYNKFYELCNNKINYGFYGDDWEYALSLAIAHYICITDIDYVQAIGADPVVGGVMSSRSVDGISYSYDVNRTSIDHDAYKFWARTGYGNQLINLAESIGRVGVLIV